MKIFSKSSKSRETRDLIMKLGISPTQRFFYPDKMDSSFSGCTNKDMTQYGSRIYSWIRLGRSIISNMSDHGYVCDVRVVSPFNWAFADMFLEIRIKHHGGEWSKAVYFQPSDGEGNIDPNYRHMRLYRVMNTGWKWIPVFQRAFRAEIYDAWKLTKTNGLYIVGMR